MKVKLLKPEGTCYDQLQMTFFSAQVNNFSILYIEFLKWIVVHLQNQLGNQSWLPSDRLTEYLVQ